MDTHEGIQEPEAPGSTGRAEARARKLGQAWRRIAQKGRPIARKGRLLATRARTRLGGGETGGSKATALGWVFGSARTGSTWLAAMMEEMKGQVVWREPLVGALFGNFYYKRAKRRSKTAGKHFILGEASKGSWLDSIRTFVLGEANARFLKAATPGSHLVIKEPNGSVGAPLLMEALPESRMILLVRDLRDVVASTLDGSSAGGWRYEARKDREWSTL